jgi:uncharacterized protein (TIGR02147 family)
MKPITEYLDYRTFLKDFYEAKRAESPIYSYRYMGHHLNIDASHLVKILQGHRHIGEKSINDFISYLRLADRDAEYFEALVRFNKAKSDREIKRQYERLISIRGVNPHVLGSDQYEFYQKWYYSAILMLLDYYAFSGNYQELANKLSPPVSVKEAKNAIAILKRLDLIRELPEAKYELTHKLVTTGDKCRPVAAKDFQRETMQLAIDSLERHPKDLRNISTITLTINKSDLPEIDSIIKEFRATLLKYAEQNEKPDSVYQLNIQLFPLTQQGLS